ncbi:MAG: asparagine synthase (glutamine-hydrolyzing) [Chloroflexi bacterium]|nr:asparagine synthase (glutamine-hydrolyzing) [Chloroflexota bacterium]
MCGIAGALSLGAGSSVLDTVDPMTACLFHRGPDEDGIYRDEHVALGSRRLSIVDIAGSTQPIANEDETVWVVFNGQIYNYVELRADLEKRHTFRTQGDTETLVHLYEEHGPNFLHLLRGMFVFAIWDTKKQALLLGRDRFGKKPLYYTRTDTGRPDRFQFASEIKALLGAGEVETTLDRTAVYQYLCFGFVPHPRTAYREIAAVPPAHWLQIDVQGRQTLQRYWQLPPGGTFTGTREDALDQIRTIFDESVKIRLRSDVPVGVFLSGGIDSGLVTASAARAAVEPLQSFSIGFADQRFDERPLARLVAQQYGTRHTEVVVDLGAEVARPEDLLTRLVNMYDQPYADSSAIPSNAVAREARKHLKVVMTGDGGDEIFAGYRRYTAALLADWMTATLGPVAPLAAKMAPAPRRRRGPVAFALRLMEGVALPPRERYIRWSGLFTDADAADLCRPEFLGGVTEQARSVVDARVEACIAGGIHEPAALMMAADATHVLVDDFLVKMDIATMANSLEARSPFIDHVLVEFAVSLPDRIRASAFQTKPLLRELARERLPAELVKAPKRGFEVPMASWIRHELRELVQDALLAPDARCAAVVRPAAVRQLIVEHMSEKRDHAMRIWALLNLEWWLRSERAPRTA